MTLDYFHTPQRRYWYQGTTAWGATQFISAFWEENDSESQQSSIWRQRSNIASTVETAPHDWNLFVFCFGRHLLAIFCWPLTCRPRHQTCMIPSQQQTLFPCLRRKRRETRLALKTRSLMRDLHPSIGLSVTGSKTSCRHVHPTVCPHVTPPPRLMWA